MDVDARNRSSAVVSNEKQRQTPKMNCTTVDPRPVSVQSTAYYNFVCSSLIPDICGLPGNRDHVLFTWFDV